MQSKYVKYDGYDVMVGNVTIDQYANVHMVVELENLSEGANLNIKKLFRSYSKPK